MKRILIFLLGTLACGLMAASEPASQQSWKGDSITDVLLDQLKEHRILVIPECLSHDSFDTIQLQLKLIQRWLMNDHGIHKLEIALEREIDDNALQLINENRFEKAERFATFCPPGWGLFSTQQINVDLFLTDAMRKRPGRLAVFGFENSYQYFSKTRNQYILPSELEAETGPVERIPNIRSAAPMIIQYCYSRFFRDYRSYMTIREHLEKDPQACFLVIIGNAHTFSESSYGDKDRALMKSLAIDTEKYTHTVGFYLKKNYSPCFVQTFISPEVKENTLFPYPGSGPAGNGYDRFLTDYYITLPAGPHVNEEESPLVSFPSARNFDVLRNRSFQLCTSADCETALKKLVYLWTGVVPEILRDDPNSESCTLIDPSTKKAVDFASFAPRVMSGYKDGSYIRRLREDLAGYSNRWFFQYIFRSMGKERFDILSEEEAQVVTDYWLAALTVIGSEQEQKEAKALLTRHVNSSKDPYFYFKRFYHKAYELGN